MKKLPFPERLVIFPIDGSKPKTNLAGRYSGARYNNPVDNDTVTDWWIRVFGGKLWNFLDLFLIEMQETMYLCILLVIL